ncbi:MAG: hypothetical protein M3Z17_08605 [Gemmatimonadota bacterium]|nr:hypothetical protein [Gemmatimonadota bacterium]
MAVCTSCGKSKSPSDSPPAAAIAGAASATPASTGSGGKPACPSTGKWALCSVEKRLQRAGLVARRDSGDTAMRAGFSAKPVAYALGRDSHLDLFIYPDEAALARDIAKLDTIRVAPAGKPGAWPVPPSLIRSANLAAVLVTKDAREADRVSLALTAGAPQPAR